MYVDGLTFKYRPEFGRNRNLWRDGSEQLTVYKNAEGKCYSAYIWDGRIGKRFLSLRSAMQAAVREKRKLT